MRYFVYNKLNMKLLVLNTVCNQGSIPYLINKTITYLQNNNVEVIFLCGRNIVNGNFFINLLIKFEMIIHLLITRIFDFHGFGSIIFTLVVINKIKSFKPDKIHLHNLHGYYINFPILFKYINNSGIKIYWTLHDCWAFTGHCTHFTYVGCEKWKRNCFNCPQKNTYPKSVLFDNSYMNFKLKKQTFSNLNNVEFILPSFWLQKRFNYSFLKKLPSTVLPNAIDLKQFQNSNYNHLIGKHNLYSKKVILGVSSIWNEKKGFSDFIKLSQNITLDTIIILIGLSDKQITSLPSNIIGLKRINVFSELIQYYNLADVYVNASKEETFGMTTIEALATGTPVVAYKNTPAEEILDDTVGSLANYNDIESLISSINNVLSKGKTSYSENALKKVSGNYNIDFYFSKILTIYNA